MSKSFVRTLCAGVVAFAISTGAALASPDHPVIGVVVKIGGIPWFNAMEAGDQEAGGSTGRESLHGRPDQCGPGVAGAGPLKT